MKQLAEDTVALLDHLRVKQVFVMGLSMGGMIAQELAILAPERVRAIILGCTHCGGNARISPPPHALQTLTNNAGLDQKQIIEKNLPLFFSEECLKTRPEVISAYIEAQLEAPMQPEHAFHAQLAAIRTFDSSDRLSQLMLPTLITTGSKDILVPRENAYILHERIPHSRVVEIPAAGHAIHVESCSALNALAHDFFQNRWG